MDEKKRKRTFFMFQTSPEDNRNIAALSELLHLSRSAAVRSAVEMVLMALKEEKRNGKK